MFGIVNENDPSFKQNNHDLTYTTKQMQAQPENLSEIRSDTNSVHVVAVQNGPIISFGSENNASKEIESETGVNDFLVETEDALKTCKILLFKLIL